MVPGLLFPTYFQAPNLIGSKRKKWELEVAFFFRKAQDCQTSKQPNATSCTLVPRAAKPKAHKAAKCCILLGAAASTSSIIMLTFLCDINYMFNTSPLSLFCWQPQRGRTTLDLLTVVFLKPANSSLITTLESVSYKILLKWKWLSSSFSETHFQAWLASQKPASSCVCVIASAPVPVSLILWLWGYGVRSYCYRIQAHPACRTTGQ